MTCFVIIESGSLFFLFHQKDELCSEKHHRFNLTARNNTHLKYLMSFYFKCSDVRHEAFVSSSRTF